MQHFGMNLNFFGPSIMVNLACMGTNISGYVIHNSVGKVVVGNP